MLDSYYGTFGNYREPNSVFIKMVRYAFKSEVLWSEKIANYQLKIIKYAE